MIVLDSRLWFSFRIALHTDLVATLASTESHMSEQVLQPQQERLQEEADFANAQYAPMRGDTRINTAMFGMYKDPSQMWNWRERTGRLLGNLRGKAVLDYGCGQGEESAYFAILGARVTAIDISQTGIHIGRERATANRLDIDFRVMSCTQTDFPDASFDVVHGLGILHHVGLKEGLAEVSRLLKPGGEAVFSEPLGSSPLVEKVKYRVHRAHGERLGLTPVTSGEENLRLADIYRHTEPWRYRRVYPYHLTYRARKLFLPEAFWDGSRQLDHALLAVLPPLRYFAGSAVIHLKK